MTLTEMSYYGRKIAPLAVIGLLVTFIFYLAFQLFFMYLNMQKSSVRKQSNEKNLSLKPIFDKIKKPTFGEYTPSDSIPSYVLDTIEGTPIVATSAANVYLIPKKNPSFGFLQKIYFMAKTVGIDTEITKHTLTDEKTASFYDGLRSLTIDIGNFNFNYQFTISKDNTLLKNGENVNPGTLENTAVDYLRSLDRYPEELARGKKHTTYFHLDIDSKALTPVDRIQDANMAEVDFFRPDLGTIPVVAPKYYNSPDFVVLAFTETGLQVVRAQVMLFEKSEEQVGIYPLKTGEKAWEELQAGKGYIISNNAQDKSQPVNIKSMFLAYYDSDQQQDYLQPVFVFLSENNFVAYVPAVSDEYIGQ